MRLFARARARGDRGDGKNLVGGGAILTGAEWDPRKALKLFRFRERLLQDVTDEQLDPGEPQLYFRNACESCYEG